VSTVEIEGTIDELRYANCAGVSVGGMKAAVHSSVVGNFFPTRDTRLGMFAPPK
jgi:hypothetical protein